MKSRGNVQTLKKGGPGAAWRPRRENELTEVSGSRRKISLLSSTTRRQGNRLIEISVLLFQFDHRALSTILQVISRVFQLG